jgi:hypothetical protein
MTKATALAASFATLSRAGHMCGHRDRDPATFDKPAGP